MLWAGQSCCTEEEREEKFREQRPAEGGEGRQGTTKLLLWLVKPRMSLLWFTGTSAMTLKRSGSAVTPCSCPVLASVWPQPCPGTGRVSWQSQPRALPCLHTLEHSRARPAESGSLSCTSCPSASPWHAGVPQGHLLSPWGQGSPCASLHTLSLPWHHGPGRSTGSIFVPNAIQSNCCAPNLWMGNCQSQMSTPMSWCQCPQFGVLLPDPAALFPAPHWAGSESWVSLSSWFSAIPLRDSTQPWHSWHWLGWQCCPGVPVLQPALLRCPAAAGAPAESSRGRSRAQSFSLLAS